MSPEINHRRAILVLGKIDEILSWEGTKEQEKDTRFVELGEYLCEVRSKQYWRLEKLKSFDEFLTKHFPESWRKAYYLMAIHENLTKIPKRELCEVGWSKATELVKVARKDRGHSIVQPGCTKQGNYERKVLRERWNGIQKQPRLKLDPEGYTLVRARVLERDRWRCQECGSTKNLQVHHMKRRSQLGSDAMSNLTTFSASCHGGRR